MTTQFSVENEVLKNDISSKNITCDNVASGINCNPEAAQQLDLTKTRTFNDTCIDITPANVTLMSPERAEDDVIAPRRFNNTDTNYTSGNPAIDLSEETPILFASKTDVENMTDVTLEQDSTTQNEVPAAANETT